MKKTDRKLTSRDFLYWGLALVPFIISIVFYSRLPEQVATLGKRQPGQRIFQPEYGGLWDTGIYASNGGDCQCDSRD